VRVVRLVGFAAVVLVGLVPTGARIPWGSLFRAAWRTLTAAERAGRA